MKSVRRWFGNCSSSKRREEAAANACDAADMMEITSQKNYAKAEEIQCEVDANIRRLQSLRATRAPKTTQVALMRTIQIQQQRLKTIQGMALSAQRSATSASDAMLIAENTEAHRRSAMAQREVLKNHIPDPSDIARVLDELQDGRDCMQDVALALGDSGAAGDELLDVADVDGFLLSQEIRTMAPPLSDYGQFGHRTGAVATMGMEGGAILPSAAIPNKEADAAIPAAAEVHFLA